MKTVITELSFPCEIKMKVSTENLEINFLSGHLIKIDNTNISIEESNRIIVKKIIWYYLLYFIIMKIKYIGQIIIS